MATLLAVTGTYGPEPKASQIGADFVSALNDYALSTHTKHVVKGTAQTLEDTLQWLAAEPTKPQIILWMPNISNDEEKFLPRIKELAPHALLISSKRVVEKDYSHQDVVGRLLKSRSALGLMITRGLVDLYDGAGPTERYLFEVVDPLGNVWGPKTHHASVAGMTLARRVNQLLDRQRIGSHRVGDARPFELDENFIRTVQEYGARFHRYANAVNPDRLLGNAAAKVGDRIFVSRRNIDKQGIGLDGFVEVNPTVPNVPEDEPETVEYYGDQKPSVDTPPQLCLFGAYPNVRYMIHGHTYMKGAPYTESALPCGSVEEVDEIFRMFPDQTESDFTVNLRGHGFLIMASHVSYLIMQLGNMKSRPAPEVQEV